MQEIFAAIVSVFLVQPLEAELKDQLAEFNAPLSVTSEVLACASNAAPELVDRALSDPWWAAKNTVLVWTDLTEPIAVLVEGAPNCAAAAAAIQQVSSGENA